MHSFDSERCSSREPSPLDKLENAIIRNLQDSVVDLIRNGVDINSFNPTSDLTPLEFAIVRKNHSMMKLLLAEGADSELRNLADWTPLLRACNVGFLAGVQLLVEQGANLKACSSNGSTCLLMAAKNGHLSIVSYLLEQNSIHVEATGVDGLSALHHLVLLDETDVILDFACKGVELNPKTQDDVVAVSLAAKLNKINALEALLEAGANPNARTNKSDFALYEAVAQGDNKAITLLLSHGADRRIHGKDGLTPVQLAQSKTPPRQDIIRTLLNAQRLTQYEREAALDIKTEREKHRRLESEIEDCICCPITCEVMNDPVIAADGHTYERKAIKQWVSTTRTSPVTRQALTSSTFIPNLAIKHLVDQYADFPRDS
eukprot:g1539.t1